MKYLKNLLISSSQFINSLLGGHPDETLAARCHREAFKKILWWEILEKILDCFFFWERNHCAAMHEEEVLNKQNSVDYDI